MSKRTYTADSESRRDYRLGMQAFTRADYVTAARILERNATGTDMAAFMSRYYAGRARHQLGIADLKAGRFRTAAEHFKRAREHNPGAQDLARYLVACYSALGQDAKAAREGQAALAESPHDENHRIRAALALWRSERRDQAVETLRRGIDLEPAEPELHYQLGTLLAARGQYAPAITQFNTANTLRPGHCQTLVRLAWCHAAQSNYLRSYDLLREAFELQPDEPEVALHLSLAAQAARQIHPDLSVSLPKRAPQSEDGRAVEEFSELIVRESDFAEALLTLADRDSDRDLVRLLAAALEAALRRCPEYADLHHHASCVYERLGQPDRAIFESRRAIEINPRYTNALVQLAALYAETDQHQDAIDRLQQAIAAGADYPDIHYSLGNLCRRTGRIDDARNAFQRAVDLNATHQSARQALDELICAGGR